MVRRPSACVAATGAVWAPAGTPRTADNSSAMSSRAAATRAESASIRDFT